MTRLVTGRAELAKARAELAGPVGLVPTMGALHAGHAANIDAARARCESVVVTSSSTRCSSTRPPTSTGTRAR